MAATVDLGLGNTQDPNTELSHDNTILRHPNHDLTSQYTTTILPQAKITLSSFVLGTRRATIACYE